jgi:transposase
MQFRENLTDWQAAEAVRSRIDWKYLLGYDLTDPGFHFSVLSEFRARLLSGSEAILLDKFLQRCREDTRSHDAGSSSPIVQLSSIGEQNT